MKSMMAQFKFRNILNFVLKLLTFFSLLAAITFCIWEYKKTVIHKIDKIVVDTYVSRYQSNFKKAKDLIKTDKKRSNTELEDFLSDIESIKILDRLAPVKRKTLALLTERYIESAEFDKALSVVEKWVEFDDQDLNALASYGLVLSSIPAQEEHGLKQLSDLFKKVPEGAMVAEAYAKTLLKNGHTVDAFRVFSQALAVPGNNPEGSWHVYWDRGEGFSDKNILGFRVKADESNIVKINFKLDGDTRYLRLDPPPFSRLTMYDPILSIDVAGKHDIIHISDLPKQFHQVTQNGSIFKTSGGNDPYFFWKMAERPAGEKMSVSIEFKLGLLFPEAMLEMALSEKGQLIHDELSNVHDKVALQHLLTIRESAEQDALLSVEELFDPILNSLKGTAVEMYWRAQGAAFSEEQKNSAVFDFVLDSKRVEFDLMLNFNGRADEVRVDFPGVKGRAFTITKLEIVEGDHKNLIDIKNTDFILQNNIKKQGSKIIVLGEDPHFAFKIKRTTSSAMMRVGGTVQ